MRYQTLHRSSRRHRATKVQHIQFTALIKISNQSIISEYYVTIFVANKELWLDCEFIECNYIALFNTGVFVQFTVEMSYSVIKVILHGIVLFVFIL